MFEKLVAEAIDIRYAIVNAGGMATKSAVEDVLIARHSIDRYDAHVVTNHIEFNDLDRFPLRRRFEDGEAPTINDFPEIRNVRVPFLR